MSGLAVLLSDNLCTDEICTGLERSLNLKGTYVTRCVKDLHCLCAVAYHESSPLKGRRLFSHTDWLMAFAGDIIDNESIPFRKIVNALDNREYRYFTELEGNFAICAVNRSERKLYVVSDLRSQFPIYYAQKDGSLLVSSEMSSFVRLFHPVFNEEWLWQYLFFNFQIGSTTFLSSVYRLPSSTVAEFELDSNKTILKKYKEDFKKKTNLLKGREALEYAHSIFSDRVPRYFTGCDEIACALTTGWDARTILAFAPDISNVRAYTYGTPGTMDLVNAGKIAAKLNIRHTEILFAEEFVSKLPQILCKTIYLSSGLEKITRSTLLYVYESLTSDGSEFPLVLSGIALDGMFRGHSLRGEIFSDGVFDTFITGNKKLNRGFWNAFIRCRSRDFFYETVNHTLDFLQERLGDFRDPESHLKYKIYHVYPNYFAGEMKLAGNFTTVRVPAWDSHIVDLCFSTEHGTLGLSELAGHTRGRRDECVLQAYLLCRQAPCLANVSAGGRRPDIVLKNELIYQLYRVAAGACRRIQSLLKRRTDAPLEDWDLWLGNYCKDFLAGLIGSDEAHVSNYVQRDTLEFFLNSRNTHYVAKLAKAEIIMRLIENGWIDPFAGK